MYQRFVILATLARRCSHPEIVPTQLQHELDQPMIWSVDQEEDRRQRTMTSTMAVVIQTSCQVGHVTFDVSWRTSWMN